MSIYKSIMLQRNLSALLAEHEIEEADRLYEEQKTGQELFSYTQLRRQSIKKIDRDLRELLESYKFEQAELLKEKFAEHIDLNKYISLRICFKRRYQKQKIENAIKRFSALLAEHKIEEADRLYAEQKTGQELFFYPQLRRQSIEKIYRDLRELLESYKFDQAEELKDKFAEHIDLNKYISLRECFMRRYRVENAIKKTQKWANDSLSFQLDDEQAQAVNAINSNCLVTARAGSGKTRTIVTRALYLMDQHNVPPHEILILAFNKKAAEEVERRIKIHNANNVPYVMTFHALAYSIVHPESIIFDEENNNNQSSYLQEFLDEKLKVPDYYSKARALMKEYFKSDWQRIVDGPEYRKKSELLKYLRSLPQETLKGDIVKSYGEKLIADFLFEHDIDYKYEKNWWWGDRNYRPDFTIHNEDNGGVIIEYFGLAGNSDYDEEVAAKREFWNKKEGWHLFELFPTDIARHVQNPSGFYEDFENELSKHGIRYSKLNDDEIWERIKDRSIFTFTKVCIQFIGRCEKIGWNPEKLSEVFANYRERTELENLFLPVVIELYREYIESLSNNRTDFDYLMKLAADAVNTGTLEFSRKSGTGNLGALRYIFIDEFQDFSYLFIKLLQSIRNQNDKIQLFCVGDDWQAINSFAGSDLKYFKNFGQYFDNSHHLKILTNYRSARAIVESSNNLMQGAGFPATAFSNENGNVILVDFDSYTPTTAEATIHEGDELTPVLLRIIKREIKREIKNDLHIMLLSRTNQLPYFINGATSKLDGYIEMVRSYFPDHGDYINISTVHKFKGKEADVVVLLDALEQRFPLLHPNWVFTKIFGDNPGSIIEEEMRLFYVAMTRAEKTLYILSRDKQMSPFVKSMLPHVDLINWPSYKPVPGKTETVTIKIGNQLGKRSKPTFSIKDLLNSKGYRWRTTSWPAWEKCVEKRVFKLRDLKRTGWSHNADGIEVRVCNAEEVYIHRFYVDNGEWKEKSIDNISEEDLDVSDIPCDMPF